MFCFVSPLRLDTSIVLLMVIAVDAIRGFLITISRYRNGGMEQKRRGESTHRPESKE